MSIHALAFVAEVKDFCKAAERLKSYAEEIERRFAEVKAREDAILAREWELTQLDTRNGAVATEYHIALYQLPPFARNAKKSMP